MKSTPNIHWEDWCWSRSFNTLATWCKEMTHWERPWCLQELKVGGEGDNREWEGWMASLTQWIWVWENSRRWWRTGKLAYCCPWDPKGTEKAEQLNWADDYTTEVTNSFKVTDLVDRVPEELRIEVDRGCTRCSDQNHPKIKKRKKTKLVLWGDLTNSWGKRSERQRRKGKIYPTEFQRIVRCDRKSFLNEQCKEIEENNRMGNTRHLCKKIGYIKGTFHAMMGMPKLYGPKRSRRN